MMPKPAQLNAAVIRGQTSRILASQCFLSAGRLSRFLEYIVDQSLAGAAADIKEYSIGVEVFQRGASFDPRADSVVRVEARRLRSKLRDYYETEGKDDPLVITVPTGSYVPVFAPAVKIEPERRRSLAALPALALAALALVIWFVWPRPAPPPAIAILPLENLSNDPANDFFCHSLADQVASRLGVDSHLRVITRGPAGPFAAGAALAVLPRGHVATAALEGSATFAGEKLRITVMLVDLKTYRNIWSETYDREGPDRLRLGAELAEQIAASVRQRVL